MPQDSPEIEGDGDGDAAAAVASWPAPELPEGVLTPEERDRRANAHVSQNTGNPEWYTPVVCIEAARKVLVAGLKEWCRRYPEPVVCIEAARKVLGGIDLDPATSDIAQKNGQAATFYTKDDDGLSKDWKGRVFMNPPYAADLVGKFTAKLCEHIESGDVPAAVVLVNNATETKWLQRCWASAQAVCFPAGRIKFLDEEGNPSGAPLQGQVFVYFGDAVPLFAEVFSEFGTVWGNWNDARQ